MAWEVDFLAVGEGEKSGDAIAFRFGNLTGSREEQKVMVIDGGTLEAGEHSSRAKTRRRDRDRFDT
jgi:hypothetical protein